MSVFWSAVLETWTVANDCRRESIYGHWKCAVSAAIHLQRKFSGCNSNGIHTIGNASLLFVFISFYWRKIWHRLSLQQYKGNRQIKFMSQSSVPLKQTIHFIQNCIQWSRFIKNINDWMKQNKFIWISIRTFVQNESVMHSDKSAHLILNVIIFHSLPIIPFSHSIVANSVSPAGSTW